MNLKFQDHWLNTFSRRCYLRLYYGLSLFDHWTVTSVNINTSIIWHILKPLTHYYVCICISIYAYFKVLYTIGKCLKLTSKLSFVCSCLLLSANCALLYLRIEWLMNGHMWCGKVVVIRGKLPTQCKRHSIVQKCRISARLNSWALNKFTYTTISKLSSKTVILKP